ncbi:hypothetical protein ABZS42_31640, partial [Micromonospora sp. NPDC005367]
MRGDLFRKLIARCLSIGLAVPAFLAAALTGATGWGLALAVAALGAAAVERRIRPGADTAAETTLIAAAVLVAYARRLDGGFDHDRSNSCLVGRLAGLAPSLRSRLPSRSQERPS